jgi:mannose-6-phosphate isomerase-like protein (cupin superfamily)
MSTFDKVRVYSSFDDLPVDHVRDGFWRAGVRSDGALTTLNWIEPGYVSPGPHSHEFDQISYVLTGTMRFFLGDETVEVSAPGIVYIPGGLPHGGEPVGDERVLNLDVFAPAREDYLSWTANQADFEVEAKI